MHSPKRLLEGATELNDRPAGSSVAGTPRTPWNSYYRIQRNPWCDDRLNSPTFTGTDHSPVVTRGLIGAPLEVSKRQRSYFYSKENYSIYIH